MGWRRSAVLGALPALAVTASALRPPIRPPFVATDVQAMSKMASPVTGKPYGLAAVCRAWRIARSGGYRQRTPSSDPTALCRDGRSGHEQDGFAGNRQTLWAGGGLPCLAHCPLWRLPPAHSVLRSDRPLSRRSFRP